MNDIIFKRNKKNFLKKIKNENHKKEILEYIDIRKDIEKLEKMFNKLKKYEYRKRIHALGFPEPSFEEWKRRFRL